MPIERLIDQRYRLDKLAGRGGMGAVYEANDLRLSRVVAVKILATRLFGVSGSVRRFRREAKIAASLSHPNIIEIYDFGTLRTGGAYIVMELLDGLSLRDVLKRFGSLDPEVASLWFDQLCDALQAAHRAHVIHRDLKPDNIFVCKSASSAGQIKVLDFGLAKVRLKGADSTTSLTAPGTVLGTVAYMSPEQLQGQEADERSDIFSIGVLLAEALTGLLPFDKSSHPAMMRDYNPESIRLRIAGSNAPDFERVVQRCLAKAPWQRFPSIEALKADLIPALHQFPRNLQADLGTEEQETLTLDVSIAEFLRTEKME